MSQSSTFGAPRTKIQTEHGANLDAILVERRCKLVVLTGDRAGTEVEVGKSGFLVGKDDSADLTLPDATVSREHFIIDQQGGAFVIRDQRSTNGTWIDQFRIREAYLRPGTVVRAGEVQLRFEPLFRQMDVAPSSTDRFGKLVGRSVRMRQIFTLLEKVAKTEATVVLLGETGAGKSAVARAIHDNSARHQKPFVTVDCGAIAENLIESELFGHERGAFTGAVGKRQGALEQAQGGTLFIDELADLPVHLQPRLLRVLEEREVRRVGGNESIKLDVRVIAASRKDLWSEVEAGRFREDLYFRLAVFTIPLPSLRERPQDIPLLAEAFARELEGGDKLIARVGPGGFDKLQTHPFYGNVRELRNVIERAALLDGDPSMVLAPGSGMPGGDRVVTPGGPAVPVSPLAAAVSAPAPTPDAVPDAPTTAVSEAFAESTGRFSVGDVMSAEGSAEGWTVAGSLGVSEETQRQAPAHAVPLVADCSAPFKEAKERLLEAFEAEYLRRLVERENSASAMARTAGIDRKHLYNLAKKHDVELSKKSS